MPWTRTSSSRHCWTICPVLGRPHPSPPFRFRSLAGRPTRAPADQPVLESRVLATILSRSLLSIVFHVVHCLGVGCPFGAEEGGGLSSGLTTYFSTITCLLVWTQDIFLGPQRTSKFICARLQRCGQGLGQGRTPSPLNRVSNQTPGPRPTSAAAASPTS